MMCPVDSWIKGKEIKQIRFAEITGLSRALLSWHKKNPLANWSPESARVIEVATNGDISARSLMVRSLAR